MVLSQMTYKLVEEVTMEDKYGRIVEGYRVNTPRGALLLVPVSKSMVSHRWTEHEHEWLSNLGDYRVVGLTGRRRDHYDD